MRYDEKRIAQLALLLLTASWILISQQGTKDFLHLFLSIPSISRWCLTIVSSLGLISSLQAPSVRYAVVELSLFMLLVGFSFTVAVLVQRYSQVVVGALLAAIAISAFVYEVTFFSSYVGIFIQGNPLAWPEPFSGFSSVRFFNQFQIWTLPLFNLPLILYPRLFTSIRGVLIIIAAGWWVLLFASQSRGALLAIAIAVIITMLVFRQGASRHLKTTIITAFSGWLAYLCLFFYIPDLEIKSRLTQLTEDPARIQLWQLALEMIHGNSWLGVGPMHYAYYPNHIAAHPHNSILQIAAEWGFPVAIILVALTCWGTATWCAKYFENTDTPNADNQQHLWIALFCALIAGMAYSIVSGVIVTPLSQTMLSVIVGLMLGLYYLAPASTVVSITQTTGLRVITGVIMAVILWSLIPDIMLRMKQEISVPQSKLFVLGPRFWQEGGIPH